MVSIRKFFGRLTSIFKSEVTIEVIHRNYRREKIHNPELVSIDALSVGQAEFRKPFKSGGSFVVSIPEGWVNFLAHRRIVKLRFLTNKDKEFFLLINKPSEEELADAT